MHGAFYSLLSIFVIPVVPCKFVWLGDSKVPYLGDHLLWGDKVGLKMLH